MPAFGLFLAMVFVSGCGGGGGVEHDSTAITRPREPLQALTPLSSRRFLAA